MGREEYIKWHDKKVSYVVNIKEGHENTFHGLRYRGFIGRSFTVNWNPDWKWYCCGVHFFFEEELEFKKIIDQDRL